MPDTAISREHWLQLRLDESSGLRAGRLVLPYGLRIPDHTQYTRTDLGFDKWHGAYGLEYDVYSESWFIAAALSAAPLDVVVGR